MSIAKKELALQTFVRTIEEMNALNLDEIDTQLLPKNFKSTKTFMLVLERIKYARRMKVPLVAITGAHGAGKTSAVRYYAADEGLTLWEIVAGTQPKHLLNQLCNKLAIDIGKGWMMQVDTVVHQLAENPRTVILDEAQRLEYHSFDLLKYIADQTESTFVLVGSASLQARIERWPDIDSRCPVKVKVEAMDLDEFCIHFATDGYSSEALAEMHRVTKGVMRNATWLTLHINEALQKSKIQREQIGAAHIRKLADKLL